MFFSSNGKQGFGGYDVFKMDLNKGTAAMNVGEPVNTSKDDFAFTYNATKKVGFFSSNRDGNDDIYKADPICNFRATVVVKDEMTGNVIEGATVFITDINQKILTNQNTDVNGKSESMLTCLPTIVSYASKSGYENSSLIKLNLKKMSLLLM